MNERNEAMKIFTIFYMYLVLFQYFTSVWISTYTCIYSPPTTILYNTYKIPNKFPYLPLLYHVGLSEYDSECLTNPLLY